VRAAAVAAVVEAGIDHHFVVDHVSFRGGHGTDGLVQAGQLCAVGELPVVVGVYLLALRHPLLVARQIADLEASSPGRLVLGVGVGGEDRSEVANCGVDPATRGRRTDESLAVLRRLLDGERVTHHGEFFSLDAAAVRPAPPERIPIVIGGRSEAALRRAGRHGDGWLAAWVTPDRFARSAASVAAEAGDKQLHHGLQLWAGFGPDRATARERVAREMYDFYRLPFEPFERTTPHGTPAEVADQLRPYVELGVETFNIHPCAGDPAAGLEAVGEVASMLR
jgi:alkanesulfonate monooxygenase SsuD/methylene tetrahydromethanopterin reductase-like flavin-dependent oxidoreductase (luciferase family)